MTDQEHLFDTLNKALKSHFWVIKYAVYPVSALLGIALILGIWWGMDLKSARSDVEQIRTDMALKAREIEISSRELDLQAKDRFRSLSEQFKSMEADFARIGGEYQRLQTRYNEALSKNQVLFSALQADNRSLSDFSEGIKKSVSKYTTEIELAKQGAEQRKKDAEFLVQQTSQKLGSVQTSIVLLTEYLVLVQNGRSTFPDPNINREISLLNEILRTLVPNDLERNAIIQRINKSTQGK